MIISMLMACSGDKTDPTADTDSSVDDGIDGDADADADSDADTDADADADSDADADADSDADADTGSTADTGGGGRGGTYAGSFTVDVADSGILVNYDSCGDAFTVTVSPGAVPEITGSGQCTMAGPLAGQVFAVVIDGTLALDPVVSGDATITWPGVPYPLADAWSGSFTGPDTVTGSFQGYWQNGSQGFEWTASFEGTR